MEKNKWNTKLFIKNKTPKLNELIYAGAKLVCVKNTGKKSKPGEEIRPETQIEIYENRPKWLKKKKRKDAGTCRDKNEKATQGKMTIQFEEINQTVLVKEGRLKSHRQRVKQYRQNRAFQNNERKFCQQMGEMTRKHTNNQVQQKADTIMATKRSYKSRMDE